MADLTGEEVQQSRVMPTELLGDDPGQEPEVIVPKNQEGVAVSWMFEGQRSSFQEAASRNNQQMGGTRILSSWEVDSKNPPSSCVHPTRKWDDEASGRTASEFTKMRFPGLDLTEEVLDRHKMRYASDSSGLSSPIEPGYSRKSRKEEWMDETTELLRMQIAEQQKITAMIKAQTEMLAGMSSYLRSMFGLLHNIYRVSLTQNESLTQIGNALDDVAYSVQWMTPQAPEEPSKKAEPSRAELEAEALRMAERAATADKNPEIPTLTPGVMFGDDSKRRKPPPPAVMEPAEFRSKYN